MVCLCHGVSERKVARAIDRGACTIQDVGEACAAGTQCHGCHSTIEELLAERSAVSVGVRGARIRSALA
jgi:bacterioferritin-associated ferredoxin